MQIRITIIIKEYYKQYSHTYITVIMSRNYVRHVIYTILAIESDGKWAIAAFGIKVCYFFARVMTESRANDLAP